MWPHPSYPVCGSCSFSVLCAVTPPQDRMGHLLCARYTVVRPTPSTFAMSTSLRPPLSRVTSASNRIAAAALLSLCLPHQILKIRSLLSVEGHMIQFSTSWIHRCCLTRFFQSSVGLSNLRYDPAQITGKFLLLSVRPLCTVR